MYQDIQEKAVRLLEETDAAMTLFDMADRLEEPVDRLQYALNLLCEQGRLAITKKGKYAVPALLGLVPAKASALRNGSPIALRADGEPTLKIRNPGLLRVLPGDSLLIRILNDEECETVAITCRGMTVLPAFLHVSVRQERGHAQRRSRIVTATPCDRRISCPVCVEDHPDARNDAIALLSIDRYPEGDRPMLAHITRILGNSGDMLTRLRVIAEQHGFPTDFPKSVEAEARRHSGPLSESELAGREDLRSMTVFTVDGPFSKDFDDAVSLQTLPAGRFRLGVHIADVSHYVREGSATDREALNRGVSLYLPGYTVPMLPEALSNHLCSLVPGEDRLTVSVLMDFDGGRIEDHRIFCSVIRSAARLTYDQVNRFAEGDSGAVPEAVAPVLCDMLSLSRSIRSRRFSAGCIDLDLPETEFRLDEAGCPAEIFAAPRGEAERMIEDFMLSANETVAMLARTTETPLLYRIHEEPDSDRITDLGRFLAGLGIPARVPSNPHPNELQRVLEITSDHPAADPIRRMLLRSLKRARYSENPVGHYALAMEDYCHFTSPIRRYPDLVVHRMLKRLISGALLPDSGARMAEFAAACSAREQESVSAERDGDSLMKARYMRDHIGEEFDGRISGVTAWGLYVTLENTVEGLVHISTLDDYYEFDRERGLLVSTGSRWVFGMGDRVRIRVENADVDRAEIDFTLVAAELREK